jgi:hypothetical protein
MSLDTNQIVKIYQIPRFSVNNTVLPTVPIKWLLKVYNKSQLYINIINKAMEIGIINYMDPSCIDDETLEENYKKAVFYYLPHHCKDLEWKKYNIWSYQQLNLHDCCDGKCPYSKYYKYHNDMTLKEILDACFSKKHYCM